jgi:type II secretory pathway component PulF
MPRFHYQAIDEHQRVAEGHIESDDLKSALLALEQRGLEVTSIDQVDIEPRAAQEPTSPFAPTSHFTSTSTFPGRPTNSADEPGAEHQSLRRQIQQVLQRGKPLAPALVAYAQELPPGRQRRRLRAIAKQLAQGDVDGMSRQMDKDLIPLLSLSASTGDPSLILNGIVNESRKSDAVRRRFASALAYPGLLLVIVLAVLSFFTWLIVPTFREIFSDFGVELPGATRMVLGFHDSVRNSHGLFLLIPACCLAAAFVLLVMGPTNSVRDRVLQWLPLLGPSAKLSAQSKFSRYMADLVQAQVPLADALRISGRNTGSSLLRKEANELARLFESGSTNLAEFPLRNIPYTVLHACQSNAKPEAAAEVLRELSRMFEEQTNNRLSLAGNIFEPLLILGLGFGVGLHVVALMLPLVNLIQNLT